jgi:hypothetical protein
MHSQSVLFSALCYVLGDALPSSSNRDMKHITTQHVVARIVDRRTSQVDSMQ